jgi:large subunit ribosomal protein L2
MKIKNFTLLKNSKFFSFGNHSKSGRNYLGRICVRHRGGSSAKKIKFKSLDFFRRLNSLGTVLKVFKDLNRTSFLGLILYNNGLLSNLTLSEQVFPGDKIYSGDRKIYLNFGSTILPNNMKLFSLVSNVELYPFKGSEARPFPGWSIYPGYPTS